LLVNSTIGAPVDDDLKGTPIDPAHPQHPVPPFPYVQRDFEAAHPDGHVLAGTLTIPDEASFGKGPHPAVILVSGSGLQDRNESVAGHKPFLVLADYLTRHGIAVARYDDRGVGESTGRDTLADVTTTHFATDTEAVLTFLRTQPEIDSKRIGLAGHSEGGIIAPMVASRPANEIAFVVLLAATGVPGREVMLLQNRLMHEAIKADPKVIDEVVAKQALVFDLITGGAPDQEIEAAVAALLEVPSPMHKIPGEREPIIKALVQGTRTPWMIEFMTLDPRVALAKVRCPVLALNGTKDLQVWPDQNLAEIERVLTESRIDLTVKRYEGLNHLFQPAETGAASEYASIKTTFDESVMRDIAEWITLKMEIARDGQAR